MTLDVSAQQILRVRQSENKLKILACPESARATFAAHGAPDCFKPVRKHFRCSIPRDVSATLKHIYRASLARSRLIKIHSERAAASLIISFFKVSKKRHAIAIRRKLISRILSNFIYCASLPPHQQHRQGKWVRERENLPLIASQAEQLFPSERETIQNSGGAGSPFGHCCWWHLNPVLGVWLRLPLSRSIHCPLIINYTNINKSPALPEESCQNDEPVSSKKLTFFPPLLRTRHTKRPLYANKHLLGCVDGCRCVCLCVIMMNGAWQAVEWYCFGGPVKGHVSQYSRKSFFR